MFRKYIRDYIRDYMDTYRLYYMKQLWGDKEKRELLFFLMFLSILLMLDLKGKGIIVLAIFVPMFLSFFSGLLRPIRPGKMMYLCPMDRKERRSYIYGSYYFRIILHMLFAVLGIGVLVLFFRCDMLSVLEILLNDFMITIYIMPEQKVVNQWEISKEEQMKIFPQEMAIILNSIQAVFIAKEQEYAGAVFSSNGDGHHLIGKGIILLIFFLIELPLYLQYRKYVKKELEDAVFFEGGAK